MGHPAQAEDLDVWVESPPEGGGSGVIDSIGETIAAVGNKISEAIEDR